LAKNGGASQRRNNRELFCFLCVFLNELHDMLPDLVAHSAFFVVLR
jgi:hypothetical protein